MDDVVETIPGNGVASLLLSDLFTGLVNPVEGVLRISTSSGIVASGLRIRINERSEVLLSAQPAIAENGVADLILPLVVSGSGFVSHIVLFSRASGQTNCGSIKFLTESGTPWPAINVPKKPKGQLTSQ